MTADDRAWSDWPMAAGVSFACMHNDQRCNIIYITSMQTIIIPLKHVMYTCIKYHINLVRELFRNNLGHDDICHRYILYTAEIRTKHIDFLSCLMLARNISGIFIPGAASHFFQLLLPRGYLLQWSSNHAKHDDVFKWKHFPRYWPFVRGIRSPVNSPQRPMTRSFKVFCDLRSQKRLSKQS